MGWLARLWELWLHFPLFYISTDHQGPLKLPENSLVPVSSGHRNCVNSPHNRSCWFGKYNIWTDYEEITPDTGKVREVAVFSLLFPARLKFSV